MHLRSVRGPAILISTNVAQTSSFFFSLLGKKTQNLIDRLIWELVQLCAPQNDSAIQQMAGECLGELGAVDPYAIAFSFPHENNGTERAAKKHQMAAKVRFEC